MAVWGEEMHNSHPRCKSGTEGGSIDYARDGTTAAGVGAPVVAAPTTPVPPIAGRLMDTILHLRIPRGFPGHDELECCERIA